jgi:hypothetical protein
MPCVDNTPRYLYVVDFEGNEIAGSRIEIEDWMTWREIALIEQRMRTKIGDDCEVRDSILDEGMP